MKFQQNRSFMRAGQAIEAAILVFAVLGSPAVLAADEGDLTAKYVMEHMKAEERLPYLAGVVEGLAYARYARDNKDLQADYKTTVGMKCIYDWFYKDNQKTLNTIYAAFGRFGDYPPGAVLSALQKKACGE